MSGKILSAETVEGLGWMLEFAEFEKFKASHEALRAELAEERAHADEQARLLIDLKFVTDSGAGACPACARVVTHNVNCELVETIAAHAARRSAGKGEK